MSHPQYTQKHIEMDILITPESFNHLLVAVVVIAVVIAAARVLLYIKS